MKSKKKPKTIDRHQDRLLKAVQNYVEKNGGKLLVIGGIEIQKWPSDNAYCFRVAVKCMGKLPAKVEFNDKQI